MKILQNEIWKIYALCLALLLLCTACGRSSAHCCLHESIPSEALCVVDLATGDIAELTVGDNNGAMSWMFIGSASVVVEPYKARATIPAEAREVNTALFCNDCLALIEAAPNTGYVLADLYDLDNVQLYPIEAGNSFTLRDYSVQIGFEVNGDKVVAVTDKKGVHRPSLVYMR